MNVPWTPVATFYPDLEHALASAKIYMRDRALLKLPATVTKLINSQRNHVGWVCKETGVEWRIFKHIGVR